MVALDCRFGAKDSMLLLPVVVGACWLRPGGGGIEYTSFAGRGRRANHTSSLHGCSRSSIQFNISKPSVLQNSCLLSSFTIFECHRVPHSEIQNSTISLTTFVRRNKTHHQTATNKNIQHVVHPRKDRSPQILHRPPLYRDPPHAHPRRLSLSHSHHTRNPPPPRPPQCLHGHDDERASPRLRTHRRRPSRQMRHRHGPRPDLLRGSGPRELVQGRRGACARA
jgi:hypothetical protein